MPIHNVDDNLVYIFDVSLKDINPPIWRRLLVPASMTLDRLHDTLQIAMGWTDSHLHRFIINGEEFGRPDYEERYVDGAQIRDERRVRLGTLLPVVPAAFLYEYDYGDSWLHMLVVEWVLYASPGEPFPFCEDGKRACPPEDVGGVSGYEELLAVLANPEHEDHEMMRTWAGKDYDPEAFDIDAINLALRRL